MTLVLKFLFLLRFSGSFFQSLIGENQLVHPLSAYIFLLKNLNTWHSFLNTKQTKLPLKKRINPIYSLVLLYFPFKISSRDSKKTILAIKAFLFFLIRLFTFVWLWYREKRWWWSLALEIGIITQIFTETPTPWFIQFMFAITPAHANTWNKIGKMNLFVIV